MRLALRLTISGVLVLLACVIVLGLISAVQIIQTYDIMDEINKEKLVEFICGLQQEDGSFTGDSWGTLLSSF